MDDINEILNYNFINIGEIHINLSHVIIVLFIILLTRLVYTLFSKIANRYFSKKEIDSGRKYASLQFLKYIIYTIGSLTALEYAGISLSLIWGGAAALLVGIGLGMQQTFNDLVSGIILLIEGSVEVDDIIEVDGIVGQVTAIGIRTSKVETFDKISLLIPNSKLVGDKATNWNHTKTPTRFRIHVGVSYSSNVEQVTALLLQVANNNESVLKKPTPEIQFSDFGESSLDFILLFYSYNYKRIEFVKSDMRYQIRKIFIDNNIEIPFPQRDVWMKS